MMLSIDLLRISCLYINYNAQNIDFMLAYSR